MDTLTFRLAEQADFSLLQELYRDAGDWLHDVKGIRDQWDRDIPQEEAQQLIASGQTYLASLGGEVIGAMHLADKASLPWDEAQGDDALYVHALTVRRRFAGRGLGRQMLAWAEEAARQQGRRYLRLDCMGDNLGLRRYYAGAGFRDLGRHPRYAWYALFEKEVGCLS